MLGLARQQLRFSRHAPAVTGKCAITTDHPMTGYYDSQLVGGTGAGNVPYRFRFADGVSQLLITDGFTARYRAQCLPDLLLKSSAANVQR